jgi:RNA polymerase sigma factor (TIGR02999 family)
MSELTELLVAVRTGDNDALNRLLALLYDDLRQLARARLKRSEPITVLDTTALVHESYLRLVQNAGLDINDRAHFLRYASRTMRSVIVDLVRKRHSERHGGNVQHVTLNTDIAENAHASEEEIIRISDALDELAQTDARLVQVVEMRYFGGLTEEQIASSLDVTDRTVRRDWQKARLLLMAALK